MAKIRRASREAGDILYARGATRGLLAFDATTPFKPVSGSVRRPWDQRIADRAISDASGRVGDSLRTKAGKIPRQRSLAKNRSGSPRTPIG